MFLHIPEEKNQELEKVHKNKKNNIYTKLNLR